MGTVNCVCVCVPGYPEFDLQQDKQGSSPEEALGEHPVPDLLGAGSGWWPAHHPDCAAGRLPSE